MPAWLCGLRWWQEIKVTTSDVSFTFTRATGANSFGTPSQLDSLEPESWIGELLVSNANQQTIGWGSPHPVGNESLVNQRLSTRRPCIEPLAFSPFDELRLRQQVILEDAGHSFIATEDMGKASHQVLQSWRATNPSEARKGKVYATDFFSDMPRNGKNQVGSMCHCQRDRRSMAAAPTRTGWSTTKGSLFCSMLLFRWMN